MSVQYIHELKLNKDDKFSEQFNLCSDLFKKSTDEKLSEEERKAAWEHFIEERIKLEQGTY